MIALASVLCEQQAGTLQVGGGREAEMKEAFFTNLSRKLGRPLCYNNISQRLAVPNEWREHLSLVEERCRAGSKALPMFSPRPFTNRFTMKNCQVFINMPAWRPILLGPDQQKMRAFADPAVRRELFAEAVENRGSYWGRGFLGRWDVITVTKPARERNEGLRGKTIEDVARMQRKHAVDALLDLALDEALETEFDPEAVAEIIRSPYVVVGLSDGGAHVVYDIGCGYSTGMIAKYVRDMGVLTLEEAVRKLTSHSAEVFGIIDRGLVKEGLAADLVVFDPGTIGPREPVKVNDFPGGSPRLTQLADGIKYTIVNGQVALEDNRPTGALAGRVLRNERYVRRSPG
jgi:N-acyl-D-amino-acid deacylase